MISQDTKDNVFNQINLFRENELKNTGKDVYAYRFYVEPEIAIDRANFFKFINTEIFNSRNEYTKVIDLTFGSGNLTSHILLDNDIDFSKLILNDKNIDDANFSDELNDIADEITDNDILLPASYSKEMPFNLIVFNPQIGGKDRNIGGIKVDGYKKGMLADSVPVQLDFHLLDENQLTALSGYLDLSDCITCIDNSEHSIRIHSNILSKTDMKERFEKLKIFNYYDIFYQGKKGKEEGSHSDIVKFRINIEKMIDNDTVIAFMGNNKEFDAFFHEFNARYIYNAEKGKSFIIGHKNDIDRKVCYKKDHEIYLEVDCEQKYQAKQVDLEKTLNGIHEILSDLKSLDGGELFVLEDKDGIQANPKSKTTQSPFKNFLFNLYEETK